MRVAQFIIDPQKDFVIAPDFHGSLGVPGAYEDMLKIADHIKKTNPDGIFITLDTHEKMDIAHPAWWIDENGNNPSDFTEISEKDIISGKWKTVNEVEQEYSLYYVKELKLNNKNPLTIWPYHCLNGSVGHTLNDQLAVALEQWEKLNNKKVTYIKKGTNPRTEHYSGLKAEVEIPEDESTKLNIKLINELNSYDRIEVSGETSSHCLGGSLIDLLENMPEKDRSKVVVLSNCTSPVVGFEKQAEMYIEKAKNLGAEIITVNNTKKLSI